MRSSNKLITKFCRITRSNKSTAPLIQDKATIKNRINKLTMNSFLKLPVYLFAWKIIYKSFPLNFSVTKMKTCYIILTSFPIHKTKKIQEKLFNLKKISIKFKEKFRLKSKKL